MEYHPNGGRPVGVHLALDRVPGMARELTDAGYAALSILNEHGTGLEHFLTAGLDEETCRAIGHQPRGRGVLGDLILDPHPLRLADVRGHLSSYGFPDHHPVMRTFLGVPVMIRGYAWGSLYLTEKAEGEFTDADEQAIVALAKEAADTISFERGSQGKEATK
jgi:two-component system, NarL family, sensor histidine kinase DevS